MVFINLQNLKLFCNLTSQSKKLKEAVLFNFVFLLLNILCSIRMGFYIHLILKLCDLLFQHITIAVVKYNSIMLLLSVILYHLVNLLVSTHQTFNHLTFLISFKHTYKMTRHYDILIHLTFLILNKNIDLILILIAIILSYLN